MGLRRVFSRVTAASGRGDPRLGVAVGAAISITVATLFVYFPVKFTQEMEFTTYDFRVENFPPDVRDSKQILHIDMDDNTLEALEYPFPRSRFAHVIRALHYLGASLIVLDVEFKHRKLSQRRAGDRTVMYDPETGLPTPDSYLRHSGNPAIDAEDLVLRRAIEEAGNVILGYSFDKENRLSEDVQRLLERLKQRPELLVGKPVPEVAAEMGVSVTLIEENHGLLHERVAEHLVQAFLAKNPKVFLPGLQEQYPALQLELQWAYAKSCSESFLQSKKVDEAFEIPSGNEPGNILVPTPPFLEMALGAGMTNPAADVDGVIRRSRLYLNWKGTPYFYMGAEAAFRFLETPDLRSRIRVFPDHVRVDLVTRAPPERVERSLRIPTDPTGRTPVLWRGDTQNPLYRHAEKSPSDPEVVVYRTRAPFLEFIKFHETKFDIFDQGIRQHIEGAEGKRPEEYQEYIVLSDRYRLHCGDTGSVGAAIPGSESRRMLQRLSEIQNRILDQYRLQIEKAKAALAGSMPERAKEETRKHLARLERNHQQLSPSVELEKKLRPLVEGKICFIGSTSTASGDLHPTTLHEATPGVNVHAEIANMLLTDQFMTEAPKTLDFIFVAIPGLLISMAVAFSSTRSAILVSLLVTFSAASFSVITFTHWRYLVSGAAPLVAAVFSYAASVAFKELVTTKSQKLLQRELAVKTSPELVELVLKRPEIVSKPRRIESSVLFTDVADFTSLSEGMPPENLVPFINRYLERMTQVLKRRHAFLDKYIGDGIMALFGVPVESEDHAVHACLAALEMQESLNELNAELIIEGLPQISMRVGINTGVVSAGYVGAHDRKDYTVMGDNVNLASRLEGANKHYGTLVMVAESTRVLAGTRFLFRELDNVRVVGKSQAVRIFELLAESGGVAPFPAGFLPAYEEAIRLFRERQWETARDKFEEALRLKSDDEPSQQYVRRCEALMMNPPPPDWDGVFELLSK